jgi:GntR family transcriptional regulator, galactonate operon transcriptional repressor
MTRRHRLVMQAVLADIVEGRHPEGELLPPELELVGQFGTSRGVVRETMRGLEERRVISVRHGLGARVRPCSDWDVLDEDVLLALIAHDGGRTIVGEYLECRTALECEAAGLAALHAGTGDLAAMAQALQRMEVTLEHAPARAAEDLFHDADIAFHRAVIDGSGNRVLGRMAEPLQRRLAVVRRPLGRPDRRAEVAIPEHRRIAAAIAEGDAQEARAAMAEHLATVAQYLSELIDEGAGT